MHGKRMMHGMRCTDHRMFRAQRERDAMKAGTKITVTWTFTGRVESATVARTTKDMLPLPADYVPVRFAQGVVLVHSSIIKVA